MIIWRFGKVLAFFSFLLLLPSCEEKIKPSILATVDSRSLPQQESWNSTITVSDSGKIRAIIRAGNLRIYDSTQQTELRNGVYVRFFGETGQETSHLTSDEGTVDENTNDLEAIKNVLVVSSDSSHLRSEHLFWSDKRQLIFTPDFVSITTPKEKLQGHGFESDQNLKHYRIFQVSGKAQSQWNQ
ncbi:MAG: LPS export ABC transporter periplasmic protein LptC [Bacteroidota bacterium]